MTETKNSGECYDCGGATYLSPKGYYNKRCNKCRTIYLKSNGKATRTSAFNGVCKDCGGEAYLYKVVNGVNFYRSRCNTCIKAERSGRLGKIQKQLKQDKTEFNLWMQTCEKRNWMGSLEDINNIITYFDIFGVQTESFDGLTASKQLQYMWQYLMNIYLGKVSADRTNKKVYVGNKSYISGPENLICKCGGTAIKFRYKVELLYRCRKCLEIFSYDEIAKK